MKKYIYENSAKLNISPETDSVKWKNLYYLHLKGMALQLLNGEERKLNKI